MRMHTRHVTWLAAARQPIGRAFDIGHPRLAKMWLESSASASCNQLCNQCRTVKMPLFEQYTIATVAQLAAHHMRPRCDAYTFDTYITSWWRKSHQHYASNGSYTWRKRTRDRRRRHIALLACPRIWQHQVTIASCCTHASSRRTPGGATINTYYGITDDNVPEKPWCLCSL